MDQREQSVSAPRGPPHAVAQAHLAAADDVMADLIARLGDCTLWHTAREAFPTLCSAIIGQQISTRAAATVEARLRQALGGQLEAQAILRADEARLRGAGLSAAKARYLRALAEARDTVTVEALQPLDDVAATKQLTAIHGIGPWTAEMFLIFVLQRPDVFSMGDVGLRNMINRLYAGGAKLDARATRAITERWAPWRSIACWYLWRLTDGDDGAWQ